ncbi:hypothetical protein ACMXYO_10100 [Neptuniibacter sp. QD37_6]|uniref:hypothetical protein n=1 Tax=Neptuniibacter sp. QD37_6 TaxID=3398210 RepID=UPI0039F5B6CC
MKQSGFVYAFHPVVFTMSDTKQLKAQLRPNGTVPKINTKTLHAHSVRKRNWSETGQEEDEVSDTQNITFGKTEQFRNSERA